MDVAGRRDFTADEWATMQQAVIASGVLVSLADGTPDRDEFFVLGKELRSARFAHRSQLVHELADMPLPNVEQGPRVTFAAYREPGLDAIRAATGIVGRKAPAELADFRAFLLRLAEVVADANRKGDALGVGLQRRTPGEKEAIEAVRTAMA